MRTYPRLGRAVSTTIFLTLIAAYAVMLVMLSGCDSTVQSRRNPDQRVTLEQYQAEGDELAEEKLREARRADARFTLAVKKLQAASEVDLAELVAAHDEAVEKYTAEAKTIRETTAATIQAVQARQDRWLSGLSTVAGVAQASGFPPAALFGGLLAGGVGLWRARVNGSRAKTAEDRVASKEAEALALKEAAARVIDSLDLLKEIAPEVKAAFKAHAPTLLDWQGAAGVKFVQSVQNS